MKKLAFIIITATVYSGVLGSDLILDTQQRLEQYSQKNTPLIEAIKKKQTNKALELIKQNPLDKNQGPDDLSLFFAIAHKQPQVVEALLQSGADTCSQFGGETPLYLTVKLDLLDIAKVLLKYKANPNNDWNIVGERPLGRAILRENCPMVNLLLKNNVSPNARDANKITPLGIALRLGDRPGVKNIVTALILHGAHPNELCTEFDTPLTFATNHNLKKLVRLLLGQKIINPDQVNHFKQNPLEISVEKKYHEITELLLSHGANPHGNPLRKKNFLQIADYNCDKQSIKLLIEHGANIENYSIYEALSRGYDEVVEILKRQKAPALPKNLKKDKLHYHISCSGSHMDFNNRHTKSALFLIQEGVDLNIPNTDNKTPLYLAVEGGKNTIATALIENGASINMGIKKPGLLHLALNSNDDSMVHYLIQKGVNTHIKNHYGETPLHAATIANKHEIVSALLEKDTSQINSKDKKGNTPLHYAVHRSESITELLIEYNADPSIENNEQESPLDYAKLNKENLIPILTKKNPIKLEKTALHKAIKSYAPYSETEQLIKNNPSMINAQDKNGNTPLHLACFKSYPERIKLLLENGANPNLKNLRNETPLHIAVNHSYPSEVYKIVELLINYKACKSTKNIFKKTPLDLIEWHENNPLKELLKE